MKFICFILLSVNLVCFESCTNNSDSTIEVIESQIISISCPSTVNSGNNVEVKVQFTGENGCSKPHNIKAKKVGQLIQLQAFYSRPKNPEICTTELPIFTLSYTFFADLPGPYFFQSAGNSLIADTLTVY